MSMAIVLAAGKGTRMQSELPKVLVQAQGRPLVDYVLDALDEAGFEQKVVVIGYRADHGARSIVGTFRSGVC